MIYCTIWFQYLIIPSFQASSPKHKFHRGIAWYPFLWLTQINGSKRRWVINSQDLYRPKSEHLRNHLKSNQNTFFFFFSRNGNTFKAIYCSNNFFSQKVFDFDSIALILDGSTSFLLFSCSSFSCEEVDDNGKMGIGQHLIIDSCKSLPFCICILWWLLWSYYWYEKRQW